MFNPELEALDRDALAARQLEGMRGTLARVKTNPRYAARLGRVDPRDVRSAKDWERLPFLTKEELRDAYPYGLACAPREEFLRLHMSSGTTGNP
ncbi:MAG: phenylacetate--CoA ligase family protein, partial [Candidatus Rokubacteria bacterium]|nr:phenylacetate--CoA ligase family protein [Candidatus Rokubacteria bacterium]